MPIELDGCRLNEPENATTLWCMMANARKGQRKAIETGNINSFVYYSAALGAYNDVLALGLDPALRPDGSETDKP